MRSNNGNGKRLTTQSSVSSAVESIYDIKALNLNREGIVDERTPEEILDTIEAKGREVAEALAALRLTGKVSKRDE